MKPLIVVTVYNRFKETTLTLQSLFDTGAAADGQVVVFDNASRDGAADVVRRFFDEGKLGRGGAVIFSVENVGCPRALNEVMAEHRQPGQAVIKVDNDCRFVTPGWVTMLHEFAEAHRGHLALVGPWYEGMTNGRSAKDHGDWLEVFPLLGHCAYHAGWFLDEAGFFDVLAEDHLYGFEDLLMCHRAVQRGYRCAALKTTVMEIVQRQNSLDVGARLGSNDEDRAAHVARLRDEYNRRVLTSISLKERYRVGADGQICVHRREAA